jgi:hypothetical protein
MTDIRLKQVVTDLPVVAVSFDWLMTPLGTFDTTQELATAVTVALGTDRLAELDDILPGFDETDRRGWWGDLDAEFLHEAVFGSWHATRLPAPRHARVLVSLGLRSMCLRRCNRLWTARFVRPLR